MFFEVKYGFYYEGKNICARAFYAECGSKWGCEMGAWRCEMHHNGF